VSRRLIIRLIIQTIRRDPTGLALPAHECSMPLLVLQPHLQRHGDRSSGGSSELRRCLGVYRPRPPRPGHVQTLDGDGFWRQRMKARTDAAQLRLGDP
jgi:hypothetical protein